jgi:hypothetical protein
MLCPDKDRTRLLIENVDELSKWLDMDSRKDPELAYWIPKNILMQGNKPFLALGCMSSMLKAFCREPGLNWLEELYRRAYLYTFLQDTHIPPCDV